MVDTCPEKMVNIISTAAITSKVRKALKEANVNGYTEFDVRGDGDSGYQGGQFESETNVMFLVVLSDEKAQSLMEKLKAYIDRGHHMMVFTSEVNVLTPSKFGG